MRRGISQRGRPPPFTCRQLRHGGPADAEAILHRLEAEAKAKPDCAARIGF